jgi:hypothetical protein
MAAWANGKLVGRGPPARVLHPDGAADDRGGQHLAVLHTPEYGLLERITGALG